MRDEGASRKVKGRVDGCHRRAKPSFVCCGLVELGRHIVLGTEVDCLCTPSRRAHTSRPAIPEGLRSGQYSKEKAQNDWGGRRSFAGRAWPQQAGTISGQWTSRPAQRGCTGPYRPSPFCGSWRTASVARVNIAVRKGETTGDPEHGDDLGGRMGGCEGQGIVCIESV